MVANRAESQELATWVYLTDLRSARTSCFRMRLRLFPLLLLFADNSMTFPTFCLSLSLSGLSPALSLFLPSSVCLSAVVAFKEK